MHDRLTQCRPSGRLQPRHPAHPVGHLLPLSRPDEAQRKAELRLDTKEGAFRLRNGKAVLVPGKPDESELYQRYRRRLRADAAAQSHRTLKPEQIDLLRRWIEQGAVETTGRSSRRAGRRCPRSPTRLAAQDLDYFVLARLEQEGLKPSPEAAKETLIRRVTLDLTGLPPTPQEVEPSSPTRRRTPTRRWWTGCWRRRATASAWRWTGSTPPATPTPTATRATARGPCGRGATGLVDGVQRQHALRPVHRRAARRRPAARRDAREQKLATGFHRNHMLNGEGGRIAEESRVDYVIDRVETTATVWLGLTLGCARCHDHKYDPFTQKEYYRLFAYFNSIAETGGGRPRRQRHPGACRLPDGREAQAQQAVAPWKRCSRRPRASLPGGAATHSPAPTRRRRRGPC